MPSDTPDQKHDQEIVLNSKSDSQEIRPPGTFVKVWEAPILPPNVFNQYPPEAQKAMLERMAREQESRREAEKRGDFLTFTIIIFCIVAGTILIYFDKGWGKFSFILAALLLFAGIGKILADTLIKKLKKLKSNEQ